MSIDVLQLNKFYASNEGLLAQKAVLATLKRLWHPLAQERLIGLGYTMPYLAAFGNDAERYCNFMPAALGAVSWPANEDCKTCLVLEDELPLADASIDRMLVVHGFEHCHNTADTLKEMWRVLTPDGRLVLVVPNRRGLWVGLEKNPFGWGRPWSRQQLTRELTEAMFNPIAWGNALHFPPTANRMILRAGPWMEKIGNRCLAGLGGVVIVEARKEVYQGIKVEKRQRAKVLIPTLAPGNATSKE